MSFRRVIYENVKKKKHSFQNKYIYILYDNCTGHRHFEVL